MMTQKYSKEEISDALTDFNKDDSNSIPEILEDFLIGVAKTGETLYPWSKVAKLIRRKLDKAICDFSAEFNMDILPPSPNVENVTFEVIKMRIIEQLNSFSGAPFTIQRLCEMLTNPRSHYKRTDKFLRAVEKNVNVVTTVDPFGRKIVCDPKPLLNGLEGDSPATLAQKNLPPTYSSAPWGAAPTSTVWPPAPPASNQQTTSATNGLDAIPRENSANHEEDVTMSNPNCPRSSDAETPDQSASVEMDQSDTRINEQTAESDDSRVTNKAADRGATVTADVTQTISTAVLAESEPDTHLASPCADSVTIATVPQPLLTVTASPQSSASVSPASSAVAAPVSSASAFSSHTMDATEAQLPVSRPGKRESTDEEDGLVSPAKRMCLEKEGLNAEVTEKTVPEEEANGDAVTNDNEANGVKSDDVTSSADVTNGDHVAEEGASKEIEKSADVAETPANEDAAVDAVTQSEDSNDSEALTTSSEDSAEQAAVDVAEEADETTKDDDGSGAADSADDTSNQ